MLHTLTLFFELYVGLSVLLSNTCHMNIFVLVYLNHFFLEFH